VKSNFLLRSPRRPPARQARRLGKEVREKNREVIGDQPNLNGVLLNRLAVPVPSVDVQRGAAARLRDELLAIRVLRDTIRKKLDELENLPAAMLRSAFSGNTS
jgi:hypothetical protein